MTPAGNAQKEAMTDKPAPVSGETPMQPPFSSLSGSNPDYERWRDYALALRAENERLVTLHKGLMAEAGGGLMLTKERIQEIHKRDPLAGGQWAAITPTERDLLCGIALLSPPAQSGAQGLLQKPKIMVICGSSRFVDIMAVVCWLLERDEGAIAMALHLLPVWYGADAGGCPDDHLAEHEGIAASMDELHLRKIDLADGIFVVNRNDYIGNSTKREVEYAMKLNKPIRWYTHDSIKDKVEAMLAAAPREEKP